jgi:putative heme-binding domain-containing protein
VPEALALDVYTAGLERADQALNERVQALDMERTDRLAQMVQVGGDVERGQRIFREHPAAQCTRCHAVGGEGSDVGPDLAGIGARVDRAYLVEALLSPSAKIADGFQMVSLSLETGDVVAGTLLQEGDTTLVLRTADGTERVVKTEDVARRTDSNASMMPPMGTLVGPAELRDLVAYLSSLRDAGSR